MSPSATIGPGVFIGPGAVINARALVETGAIVNGAAVVEHDAWVRAFAHVAPAAVLLGGAVGPDSLVGRRPSSCPRSRWFRIDARRRRVASIPAGVVARGVRPVRGQGLIAGGATREMSRVAGMTSSTTSTQASRNIATARSRRPTTSIESGRRPHRGRVQEQLQPRVGQRHEADEGGRREDQERSGGGPEISERQSLEDARDPDGEKPGPQQDARRHHVPEHRLRRSPTRGASSTPASVASGNRHPPAGRRRTNPPASR